MKLQVEKPIPEGIYPVEVVSILASEDTQQSVTFNFKMLDMPSLKRTIAGTITPKKRHKMVSWIEILLAKQINGMETVDLTKLIGLRAKAKVFYSMDGSLRVYELRPFQSKKDSRQLLTADKKGAENDRLQKN